MGLLQAAYRTYEAQAGRAGVLEAGQKEALTPVSHMLQNAQLEITLSNDGIFQSACEVSKEDSKTIIPVTVESANRTGKACAHSLCDQLIYLAPYGEEKYADYMKKLRMWSGSSFTHPKVQAVLAYEQKGTIVSDLLSTGLIAVDNQTGAPEAKYDKYLVRWRVIPAPEGVSSACWQDTSLFDSFIRYYAACRTEVKQDLCLISGVEDTVCDMHPKGVVSASFGAKLISANDASGFTYRGRFTEARQAANAGYTASQKAHSALRWVAANQGVVLGGRTFLCWNPEGCPVPNFAFLGLPSSNPPTFVSYKNELLATLLGYRQAMKPEANVIVAALDAATTGRLSITYYSELRGSDFLDRIEDWYATCCWHSRYGVQSPSLRRIVTCAFGAERGQFIDLDDRVLREHVQQMLPCIIDRRPIPQDIIRGLATRAGQPLAYTSGNRESLLSTACALIRKAHNDRVKKEEFGLALDTSNTDRSYLFGRLLAVAEQVERSTYDRDEGREPNAIRMQSVFAQRPLYAWRIISEQINPYFSRQKPGLRAYFKNIIGEITDMLPDPKDHNLDKKLDDTYLLGYYHQRSALTRKKEAADNETKTVTEDM